MAQLGFKPRSTDRLLNLDITFSRVQSLEGIEFYHVALKIFEFQLGLRKSTQHDLVYIRERMNEMKLIKKGTEKGERRGKRTKINKE